MDKSNAIPVYGRDGRLGWIENDPNGEQVRIFREDGASLRVPGDLMVRQDDGSYYLPVSSDQIPAPHGPGKRSSVVIPVIVEEAEIGRRRATRRVRIHKQVREREELVDEPVFTEKVQVERVPINRVVETPPKPRTEGDTLIIPLLEEQLVVEKRLVLREEVRITRRRETTRTPQRVTLRAEAVEVEREDPEDS